MGPGYFILAIMGCGDGAVMCEDIASRESVYRSEIECMADSDSMLEANIEAPYPMVVAQCRSISPQMAERIQRRTTS